MIEQTEKENEMKPFHDLHKRIKSDVETVMTLRDYFAASWLANKYAAHDNPYEQARRAYQIADAMIDVRVEDTNG